MTKLIKNFPLTLYAVLVILFVVSTDKNIQYDSHVIHVFFLIVLSLPLTAINQILVIFDIRNLLLFQIFPIFIFLFFISRFYPFVKVMRCSSSHCGLIARNSAR